MADIVVDDTLNKQHDEETENALAQAFQTRNYADDEDTRMRAEKMATNWLSSVETSHQERARRWRRMDDLWRQESLSPNARDYGVQLGDPFEAVEDYAAKVSSMVFGQERFLSGRSEQYEDDEKAELAAMLVEEQARTECRLPQRGVAMFREAAIYGTRIDKLVPRNRRRRLMMRDLDVLELEGRTRYEFGEMKEEVVSYLEYDLRNVSLFDFRVAETAKNIEDAERCGEFSYPSWPEIKELMEDGSYIRKPIEELLDAYSTKSNRQPYAWNVTQGTHRGISSSERMQGDRPDAGPDIPQFARFEMWGLFDLHGDNDPVECVVTLLLPAHHNQPLFPPSVPGGRVVQIRRNPYYHQRKPYLRHPVIEREDEFYGAGILEIVGRHSYFQDEMGTLALQGAYLEGAPFLEVAEASGVVEEELDGLLPGSKIPVDQPGNLNYLAPPVRSNVVLSVLEYFANKGREIAGLSRTPAIPRVAAAATLEQAQKEDQRILAYVHPFENCWLENYAELMDGYNQQFMTEERKIKTMGVNGTRAEDIRTVTPADVLIGKRFEPLVGRKLAQKIFQVQQLINWWDRMVMTNGMDLQLGRMETFNLQESAQVIWKDGFGFTDFRRFINEQPDPSKLRSANEEHRLFAMGEAPDTQRGERTIKHLEAHLAFYRMGGHLEWQDENQRRFVNHIYDTLDDFWRKAEAANPDVDELIQQFFSAQLPPATGGESEGTAIGRELATAGQAGGRGIAGPTQSPQSPMVRRPTQSASMGMTYNGGAQ